VNQDRREVVSDKHEIRHDRRQIAKAHAHDDTPAVIAGRHELRGDVNELKGDRRETAHDRVDAREDLRDPRQDRRDDRSPKPST
jgi:hypothetical protein